MNRASYPRTGGIWLGLHGGLALLGSTPVRAEEARDAEGFADTVVAAPGSADSASSTSTQAHAEALHVHLSGSIGVFGALRLEQEGDARLASLRLRFAPRLELRRDFAHGDLSFALLASGRAEADFAYLLRPEDYDAATLELYGSQLIPGEAYLSLSGAHVTLRFGEQIVNLGQGELLSLLDVANPRDLRVPLQADLEELRLPVLSTRLSVSFDRIRAELLLVHEPWFGLLAPPLGEFSPFRRLLLELPGIGPLLGERTLRYQHVPGRDPTELGALQPHVVLGLRAGRADLALQVSSLLDGLGVPALPGLSELAEASVELPTYHPRYTLFGHSGAVSLGSFVLRWELAFELARAQIVERVDARLPDWSSERLDSVRAQLGLSYAPSARTNLGLELQRSGVIDNPERRTPASHALLLPLEAPQLALRLNQQFWGDRASFTLVALCIGLIDFNAFAGRAELGYAFTDTLRLALGFLVYLPSSEFGPFYGFERHDRLYANLRWSFSQ